MDGQEVRLVARDRIDAEILFANLFFRPAGTSITYTYIISITFLFLYSSFSYFYAFQISVSFCGSFLYEASEWSAWFTTLHSIQILYLPTSAGRHLT